MPKYEITSPDGKVYEVNAPEGATQEDAIAYVQKNFAPPAKQVSMPKQDNAGTLSNIALGALKGASDIGTTLLSPVDAAYDLVTGNKGTHQWRKDSLRQFFADNADPESLPFKGGELASDVAGTAGVGGVLAKGARMIPGVANAIPSLLNSVESGGFVLGKNASPTLAGKAVDAATRAAGGATVGGVSSGMISPESAADGALLGAVIPGAAQATMAATRGARNVVNGAIKNGVGLMTGTGSEAVGAAYQAGKNGKTTFLENMRGEVPFTDVLNDAKSALGQMRAERAADYRANMAQISNDKTVLDLTPILGEVQKLQSMGNFKGQVINKNAASTVDELSSKIMEWAKLDPAEFHTPEGLDALKKAIGDIRESTDFGSGARKAADQLYNKVKSVITFQAPTYAKTMKDYEEASTLITEIEKSLSLGNKASADTSMRKLQSLMRNNVNTNYGNRLSLAGELENRGADILPAVAGQAMNSWTPRGLQAAAGTLGGLYGVATNPSALAALPLTSPRLMGELSYGLGALSGAKDKAGRLISQTLLGNQGAPLLQSKPMAGLLTVAPSVYMTNP